MLISHSEGESRKRIHTDETMTTVENCVTLESLANRRKQELKPEIDMSQNTKLRIPEVL